MHLLAEQRRLSEQWRKEHSAIIHRATKKVHKAMEGKEDSQCRLTQSMKKGSQSKERTAQMLTECEEGGAIHSKMTITA